MSVMARRFRRRRGLRCRRVRTRRSSRFRWAAIAKSKVVIPYGRSFKLAENMSPLPQDRLSFAFNYYDGVQEAQNRGFGGLMGGMKVYRYLFAFEKTFLDGLASIGVRESIDTLTATSIYYPGLAGTSTALGDVNVFGKLVLWENLETPAASQGGFNAAVAPVVGQLQGSVVTGGLSVRVPTGPSNFAGSPFSFSPRDVGIQPFLGYYVSRGNWYLQGFESIDVPTSGENVTMLYSDMGLGYWLYRNQRPGALDSGHLADSGSARQHPADEYKPVGYDGSVRDGDGGEPDLWREYGDRGPITAFAGAGDAGDGSEAVRLRSGGVVQRLLRQHEAAGTHHSACDRVLTPREVRQPGSLVSETYRNRANLALKTPAWGETCRRRLAWAGVVFFVVMEVVGLATAGLGRSRATGCCWGERFQARTARRGRWAGRAAQGWGRGERRRGRC